MRKLIFAALFALASAAAACPQQETLFNGYQFKEGTALVKGLNPYCTNAGRELADGFRQGYEDLGGKVSWVEGYRVEYSGIEAVLSTLEKLLGMRGFRYVDSAEGEYQVISTFEKVGGKNEYLFLSIEPTNRDIILVMVEGVFPHMSQ
ncbi:hypothetical protein [Deinococcus radiophilus]|uniref:Uncharacterized protein n=1 Tax=Deinococcus radiophilus TaxID=32062 RepID=A0A431W102_9DEIO|nr:hypothetical protein [Deinococcus radiophilus]RTR29033.1 hypothetical protein EJ104_04100 [Deinococcus radiophilus]